MKKLIDIAKTLETLVFFDEEVDDSLLMRNQEKIKAELPDSILKDHKSELSNPNQGFTIFPKLINDVMLNSLSIEEMHLYLATYCSFFAKPLRVIESLGLWVKIDIDITKEVNRAGGEGFLPLHIDLVNTENPPDYVALFCYNPDPLGGGATVIGNLHQVMQLVQMKYGPVIQRLLFKEGKYFGLKGVGKELNPFPLIEIRRNKVDRYRFTARLLDLISDKNSLEYDVINFIDNQLTMRTKEIMLNRGDLILINQNIVVHGRTIVGANQNQIKYDQRRILYQMFLRSNV